MTKPDGVNQSRWLYTPDRDGEQGYYRPELDALRFFAFVCVFWYHRLDYVAADPLHDPWWYRAAVLEGAFGVPVFFLLSAFLITELLLRERDRTGRIHIRAFYIRRILRIWPLYFAAFFGLALLNHFLPETGTDSPLAWLAFTFFAGNWYITLHGWIAGPVDPLWSISVEEQFYLAIPLLAAWGGRRALGWASGLLMAASYLTVLRYGLHPTPADNGMWTNSFVQFQFFCAGTLLALGLRGRLLRLPAVLRLCGFALAAALWMTAFMGFKVQSWNPQTTASGMLAGWALILGGSILFFLSVLGIGPDHVPRWLAYLGRISFGLYVFHSLCFFLIFQKLGPTLAEHGLRPRGPVWNTLGTAVVLGTSIAAAHLSFRYFERPFLRLKRRFTFVAAREETAG